MGNSFSITKIDPCRWQEYKALRLEALHEAPLAFLGMPEEEDRYADIVWIQRLVDATLPDKTRMLFAEKNGKLIGMIGILYEQNEKIKHKAHIVSFYVTPNARSQGVGKALLERALADAQERHYVKKVWLDVTTVLEPAVKLYELCGFKQVALLKDNLQFEGFFYDAFIMEKFVR
jgi:ribosomal protein S18 acetylase RimI-like enzyme